MWSFACSRLFIPLDWNLQCRITQLLMNLSACYAFLWRSRWHHQLLDTDCFNLFWFNAEMSPMQWEGNNPSCKMIGTLASCHKMHLHDYEVWWLRKLNKNDSTKETPLQTSLGCWPIEDTWERGREIVNSEQFFPKYSSKIKRFAISSKSAQKMESYEKLMAEENKERKKAKKTVAHIWMRRSVKHTKWKYHRRWR